MYIDEPNGESYLNLSSKFEFELDFIVAELKLEPNSCELGLSRAIVIDGIGRRQK